MPVTVNLKNWIPELAQEIHGNKWSPNLDFVTHLQCQQMAPKLGIKWAADMSPADVHTLENALRAHYGKETKMAPAGKRGIRNTEELFEDLKEEVGNETGSWDSIAEDGEDLVLKKFTVHDDRVTLKFTNGRKVRIFHPEPADPNRAPDGDLWDVDSALGWA